MIVLLLLHAAATLFMTGVIWFVQLVHYPFFAQAGDEDFTAYSERHSHRTTGVVAVPMIVELVTGLLLLFGRPAGIPAVLPWLGIVLLASIWASTALLQVPSHRVFAGGFDYRAWHRLVRGNWVRTIGWSARATIVILMCARVMR